MTVSRLAFGCWAMGGHGYGTVDDAESIAAVKKALELGINFFDTADVYGFGHSERILSEALDSRRHDVVIATKFGVSWDDSGKTRKDCSPKRLVEALEGSLRRLRVECIPLYQIHWHDGITPVPDLMETLLRCREAGKIRYIGCSNFPRRSGAGMLRSGAACFNAGSLQRRAKAKRGSAPGLLRTGNRRSDVRRSEQRAFLREI